MLDLGSIGTWAIVGGLGGGLLARLVNDLGGSTDIDSAWRKGMFYGALFGVMLFVYQELGY